MPEAITWTMVLTMVIGTVISMALNMVMSAIFSGGNKQATPNNLSTTVQGHSRTLSIRQAVAPREIVLGQVRKGGIITFLALAGADQDSFHVVLTLSGHRIKRIGPLYIGNEIATSEAGNGIGKFAGLISIEKKLGQPGEPAFPGLIAANLGWTAAHLQEGCSSAHVALTWDENVFGSFDVSQLNFDIWGHDQIFDSRTNAWGFTDNAAQVVAWYLNDPTFGLNSPFADEFDLAELDAGANIADEYVPVIETSAPYTIDPASSIMTLTEPMQPYAGGIPSGLWAPLLGDQVTLAGGGGVIYYWIPMSCVIGDYGAGTSDQFTGYLATSLAAALAPSGIDLSGFGLTGTLTRIAERRYCANGVFTCDLTPSTILPSLLSALGGSAGHAFKTSGLWTIKPAAYETPTTPGIDESHLRKDGFTIMSQATLRDFCNGVRGKYINPARGWQEDDYPAATDPVLVAAEGGDKWQPLNLPMELSPSRAQRIATIELLKARLELQIPQLPCKLSALRFMPTDNLPFSFARYGWEQEIFEVGAISLSKEVDDDGNPVLGVDLALRVADPNAYAWTADKAHLIPMAPKSALPRSGNVSAPGAITVTEQYYAGVDAAGVRIRALINVEPSPDAYVMAYLFSWSPAGAENWSDLPPVPMALGVPTIQAIIYDLAVGHYDFRVQALNGIGATSEPVYLRDEPIDPLPAPPDVTGFTVSQEGNVVEASWEPSDFYALAGYDFGFAPKGTTDPDLFSILDFEKKGTTVVSVSVPDGPWTFAVWGVNIGGERSAHIATADLTVVTDTNAPIYDRDELPAGLGTMSGLLRHCNGTLLVRSQYMADHYTDYSLWDKFPPDPVSSAYYITPPIDTGFDSDLRLYGRWVAQPGPEQTSPPAPTISIETWKEGESDPNTWTDNWVLGFRDLRYMRQKLVLAGITEDHVPVISSFEPVADGAPELKDGGVATIAAGGTRVDFNLAFHLTPRIRLSVIAASPLYATVSAPDKDGFTGHVWNSAGTDVGGTTPWDAEGE